MARVAKGRAFTEGADWGAIIGYLSRYQTMEEIAERTGISRQTLWRYEQGKMQPRKARRETLLKVVAQVASVYGAVPEAVQKELEAVGVTVKDRVPDVLYV